MEMAHFSIEELTVIEASRYIKDGETVFAGTGLPLMATMLAQKTHAPHLCFVAETGPIAPIVLPTPLSVSDPRLQYKAVRLGSLREVLGCMLQRGMIGLVRATGMPYGDWLARCSDVKVRRWGT